GRPPQPRRNGQTFRKYEAAELETWNPGGERLSRLEDQIVLDRPRQLRGRPAHGELQRVRWCEAQDIGQACESDEAFDLMIPIGAAGKDAQRQVDFRRRLFS